jgi:hypothetical protein
MTGTLIHLIVESLSKVALQRQVTAHELGGVGTNWRKVARMAPGLHELRQDC